MAMQMEPTHLAKCVFSSLFVFARTWLLFGESFVHVQEFRGGDEIKMELIAYDVPRKHATNMYTDKTEERMLERISTLIIWMIKRKKIS